MSALDLAIIGGTGLYALDELEALETRTLATRWGAPSDAITVGTWHGCRVGFLARHGREHQIAPHRVNYRANLAALQQLGARTVIGVNAVGGVRADMPPQALVLPDQLIDYTAGRASSFSDAEGETVVHIDFSEPYSAGLRQSLTQAARAAGVPLVADGCYGCTQGPRLETIAEVRKLQRDGVDLIGMTGMPEAALAREAGLDYACLAVVANWAAGIGGSEPISLDEIYAHLKVGTMHARAVLAAWCQQHARS
ncbi:MAG: S-methyl-5'-thioinosine phosphorylase [Xanthomonadales bacterium]|jgi:5'-methylthioinosine phosphorylase|nr:S-methyl-5'-thioinosine phosphorylase [Xanthomonadales bacterium]